MAALSSQHGGGETGGKWQTLSITGDREGGVTAGDRMTNDNDEDAGRRMRRQAAESIFSSGRSYHTS